MALGSEGDHQVRIYLVEDLIDAHVMAMDAMKPGQAMAYNVGIGKGISVREVIDASHRVTGVDFAVTEAKRRPGDPPILYADPSRIQSELGWSARYTDLDTIIATAWAWLKTHPRGYKSQ